MIDPGEAPEACARREAMEELGVRLETLEPVSRVWSSPGVSSERISLYLAPYGLADREHNIPSTLQTRFSLASMNKMFTAVATMQLVQAGKLALDDPLGRYLTDYPNRELAAKVTIGELLTNTGGTGDI